MSEQRETKLYVCECGKSFETEQWTAPVYNGFVKTDETFSFWPTSIKCECGKKLYETGKRFDAQGIFKFDHKKGTNTYSQIRFRPRGIG